MTIDAALLNILVCPENKSPLSLADEQLVAEINLKITEGLIKNRVGETIADKIDGGLIREDGQFLYPICDDIPVLLIDSAIELRT